MHTWHENEREGLLMGSGWLWWLGRQQTTWRQLRSKQAFKKSEWRSLYNPLLTYDGKIRSATPGDSCDVSFLFLNNLVQTLEAGQHKSIIISRPHDNECLQFSTHGHGHINKRKKFITYDPMVICKTWDNFHYVWGIFVQDLRSFWHSALRHTRNLLCRAWRKSWRRPNLRQPSRLSVQTLLSSRENCYNKTCFAWIKIY